MFIKRSTKTSNYNDELRGGGLKVASQCSCYKCIVVVNCLVAVQTSHSKTFYSQGHVFLKEGPLLCVYYAISIGYCKIYFLETTDLNALKLFMRDGH